MIVFMSSVYHLFSFYSFLDVPSAFHPFLAVSRAGRFDSCQHFPMAKRTKKLDMVFVLDATNSTQSVFTAMREQAMDTAFQIHTFKREVDDQYGVIIYRDPVDNPGDPEDKNEFIQLTPNREAITDYLAEVKAHGGRDDPEDWAGAFELALNSIRWRDPSKKCLFWITDANAHGSEYSTERRDRHDPEAPRLTRLIQQAAAQRIYFIGINVKKGPDPGCEKTLAKLKSIYEAASVGNLVTIQDFPCNWDHDKYEGDDWPPEVLAAFQETISATLRRGAGSAIDAVTS
jgi:hypothetical protein